MSKKSKRQSRKRSTASRRATSSAKAARSDKQEDFNPDYSQTIKDLKRIGALASVFFSILVVLSFFLR